MSSTATGGLDLSRLTDEEAKHVWKVIQRDFSLRRKEEDRLGKLKTTIEREDTKRELLGDQLKLSDSLCIRCLKPFKFLVNDKRQCIDCELFTCKSCSRYNKKEHGWVCDPCRMGRMLKIGTLEWYHENVRSRFKRFGSAKVMKSLFKRLSGDCSCSQTDLREHKEEDTHSMPEICSSLHGHDEDQAGVSDKQRNSLMRKNKRLLSVDPLDFNLDTQCSDIYRRHSFQHSRSQDGMCRRQSSIAEADLASFFKDIQLENGSHGDEDVPRDLPSSSQKSLTKPIRFDDGSYHEQRIVRARSLSKISYSSVGSANQPPSCQLSYSVEDSDEDDPQNMVYTPPPQRCSRASTPDDVPPQIFELNKRLSTIETLLTSLEQKITVSEEKEEAPSEVDLEEQQLMRKLDELTGNISDEERSEEDEPKMEEVDIESSGKRPSDVAKPFHAERRMHPTELRDRCGLSGIRVSELSQLEGQVAMAAARVQSTQSEVSVIENRIAKLSAAGMSVGYPRRKSTVISERRRLSEDFPSRPTSSARSLRKLSVM